MVSFKGDCYRYAKRNLACGDPVFSQNPVKIFIVLQNTPVFSYQICIPVISLYQALIIRGDQDQR